MSVVVRARPAFIVGRVDRFVIVSANDLDDEDFAKATDPRFRSAPWTGPKVIGALAPTDVQQRNDVMFSSVGGKDLEKFPQYYTDYDAVAPTLLKYAKPVGDLEKTKPESASTIAGILSRRNLREDDVVWVPLDARRASMTMLLERTSGKPLQAIAIDPW
jgi:hypothetical protein